MNISINFCGVLHFFLSPCGYLSVWCVISNASVFFLFVFFPRCHCCCFNCLLCCCLCIYFFLSMNLALTVDILSASNLHNECQYEIMFVGLQLQCNLNIWFIQWIWIWMCVCVCECIFLFLQASKLWRKMNDEIQCLS